MNTLYENKDTLVLLHQETINAKIARISAARLTERVYIKNTIMQALSLVVRDVCTSAPYAKPNFGPIVLAYASSQAWPPPSSRGPRPNEASAH